MYNKKSKKRINCKRKNPAEKLQAFPPIDVYSIDGLVYVNLTDLLKVCKFSLQYLDLLRATFSSHKSLNIKFDMALLPKRDFRTHNKEDFIHFFGPLQICLRNIQRLINIKIAYINIAS